MIDNNTVTTCNFSQDTIDMMGILSNLTTTDIMDNVNNGTWKTSLCLDVCKWSYQHFICTPPNNVTLVKINFEPYTSSDYVFESRPIIPPTYNWPKNMTEISLADSQFSGYFNFSTLPRGLVKLYVANQDFTGIIYVYVRLCPKTKTVNLTYFECMPSALFFFLLSSAKCAVVYT